MGQPIRGDAFGALLLVSFASASVPGRAGYALYFNATPAMQGTPDGPSIEVARGSCTDSAGACICCDGASGCCTTTNSMFKITQSFTLEAWVMYDGTGVLNYPAPVFGNLAYSLSPTPACVSQGACVVSSSAPFGPCSVSCTTTRSSAGGFLLFCGEGERGPYCGMASMLPIVGASAATMFWQLVAPVPSGAWTHLAASYRSDNGLVELYINGVLSGIQTFQTGGSTVYTTVAPFTIGGRSDPTAPNTGTDSRKYAYFRGALDELRIWQQARNPSQIMIDMLDTPACSSTTSVDSSGTCTSFVSTLLAYWPFSEAQQASGPDSLPQSVVNAAARSLPAVLFSGVLLPAWYPVPLVNGTSFMDRAASGAVAVTGGVTYSLVEDRPTYTFRMGVTGTLVFTATDPNPTDTLAIGDLPVFPENGGIPQEAVYDGLGYSGCCPQNPCAAGGPPSSCQPAYCGGSPGCFPSVGSQASRIFSWTPQANANWIVPQNGIAVTVQIREFPTNSLISSLAAPVAPRFFKTIYLYVQVPPEFVTPTLNPTATAPDQIRAYMGQVVLLQLKARIRNEGANLNVLSAEDPGMPNGANLSTPIIVPVQLPSNPLTIQRSFSWIPACGQDGQSGFVVEASSVRGASIAVATKSFNITVVPHRPAIVDFDYTPRTLRVGCKETFSASVREQLERTRNDTNATLEYSANLTYQVQLVSGVANNLTNSSSREIDLGQPMFAQSQYRETVNSLTSTLEWVPVRGQEGFNYLVCANMRTYCSPPGQVDSTACVRVTVTKCHVCLNGGDTLQSLAASYKSDFVSLYTSNVFIPNPDRIQQGTRLNIGQLYRVKAGDTLASVADRFFTNIENLLEVNPDIVERGGVAWALAPTSVAALATVPLVVGERVCVVPPRLCGVQCAAGTCRLTPAPAGTATAGG